MVLNPVEKIETEGQLRLQCVIEHSGKQESLWYSVDERYEPFVTTEKLDAFLVGALLLAMKTGEDITLRAPVSEKLFYNLTSYYMSILELVVHATKRVEIRPQSLDTGAGQTSEGAVATGFSAGIDSFCSIYDHHSGQVPDSYRITHFVFNNVGSHGEWDSERPRALFHSRYDLIKAFPEAVGMEFIKIDSNLSDLLMMNFQQTHVPRNVSALLVLQKLFGKYYYASTYRYQDTFVGESYDLASADPCAVHLLSTETFDCISSGSQHSRVEKTKRVAMVDGADRWLNVCITPDASGRNCSACEKCCRTLLTLELLGRLDGFSEVFDLDRWRTARTGYVTGTILREHSDPFVREIRELADSVGYDFPLWQRLLGSGMRLAAPVNRVLRRVAGRS